VIILVESLSRWRANPVSEEDAFGAIKAGIHALPEGVKAFLNSGSFPKSY
jgi:pyridoxine 4-dehydrogenase